MSIYCNRQLAFVGAVSRGNASGLVWERDFPSWFRAIPPERVGLNGEYDYYGLQKRVEASFRQHFSSQALAQLSISQRGRVVILQGSVATEDMLRTLVRIAEGVEGTIRVETMWVECQAKPALLSTARA